MEWIVVFDCETANSDLAESFAQGPILGNGRRSLTEKSVGQIGPLKIELFSKEHPPPHFRVSCQGETANYRISDCLKLNGGLERFDRNIRQWHAQNKQKLISTWDDRRPTNCPVGAYAE